MVFTPNKKQQLPTVDQALAGRAEPMVIENRHHVTNRPIVPPFATELQQALFGLGCFWGAEQCFWKEPAVFSTAVGYAGGYTPNPNYAEVCTGMTGHNEVVRVIFNPAEITYPQLLVIFWNAHNPTQGMRQGNDIGTQYRSGIYTYNDEQMQFAQTSKHHYQQALSRADLPTITTEILVAPTFYYAENAHQQYLAKNPDGYCGLGGTGIHYVS